VQCEILLDVLKFEITGSVAELGVLLGRGRHGLLKLLKWNRACSEDLAS